MMIELQGCLNSSLKAQVMIALMSKCYFAENQIDNKTKVSCKGVNRKQNEISWRRYMNALDGSKDMAQNTGFQNYR